MTQEERNFEVETKEKKKKKCYSWKVLQVNEAERGMLSFLDKASVWKIFFRRETAGVNEKQWVGAKWS